MKVNLKYIFVLFVLILSVNSEMDCGTNCKATLENGVLTITGSGKMEDYIYNYAPWHDSKDSIKSIVIEGITTIGISAFRECSSLTSVTIKDSVTAIGNNAFSSCSQLESPEIPSSMKMIGINAFNECPEWTEGTLGNIKWTLKSGELSFSGSGNMPNFYPGGVPWYSSRLNIKTVNIGEGITSVGDYAFDGCSNLEKVTLPSTVKSIGFNANVKGATIPADVKRPMLCGMDCSAYLSDGVLSIEGSGEMTDFDSRTYLSSSKITAPWYSKKESIKEVNISEGIIKIGNFSLYECSSLKSITIPDSVTTIGRSAFYKCSSLTSVTIPNSVTTIGEEAFSDCPITSLTITGTGEMELVLSKISKELTTVVISDGITTISDYAFEDCSSLKSITIPDSVTTIGESAFYKCSSLTSVTLPNSVTTIEWGAFSGCPITSLTITGTGEMQITPSKISKSLETVVISDGITTISKNAFEGCSSLTSVTIPNSITTMGSSAFSGCAIASLTITGTGEMNVVPSEISKELTTVVISDGITTISESAFAGCSSLTSGSIGSIKWKLNEAGELSFTGEGQMIDFEYSSARPWDASKDSIAKVTISDGITTIGKSAFEGCSEMSTIELPTNIKTIGKTAFKDCENLDSEIKLNALSSIESELFSGCKKLKKVSIGSSSFITREAGKEFTIGNAAFSGCSELKELTLPETVTKIGANAFAGCSELASAMNFTEIKSFDDIGDNAFVDCGKIPSGKVGTFSWSFSQDTSTMTFINGGRLSNIAKAKLPWQAMLTSVKSMILGDGMTEISSGTLSFYENVETLLIGKDVTSIAKRELNRCTDLSSISVASGNRKFQSIDGVLFTKADYPTLVRYPPSKQDVEYKIPTKVVEISDGAFADCSYLRVVKFCGKLNDYKNTDVVTGTSLFNVSVSSAFQNDTFYGRPLVQSLTEEDCPLEATTSSSSSHVGVIVGCVCGAVALFAIIAVVVWFKMSSKSKNENVELENASLTSDA